MKMTKSFFKKKVLKNILVFEYRTQKRMGRAMKRLMAFYDLLEIKGTGKKKISPKDLSSAEQDLSNVDGVFMSGKALKRFPQHFKATRLEREILKEIKKEKGQFGVVVVSPETGPSTLKHEIAHALWELNPRYRREVKRALSSVNLKPIFKIFKKHDYPESEFLNEAQAYLMNNPYWLKDYGLKNLDRYAGVVLQLNCIFEKYTDPNYDAFKKVAWP